MDNAPEYLDGVIFVIAVIIVAILIVPGLLEWMALGLFGAMVILVLHKVLFD